MAVILSTLALKESILTLFFMYQRARKFWMLAFKLRVRHPNC